MSILRDVSRRLFRVGITASIVACVSAVALTTGIAGTVERGPIMPVCRVESPCDAPFAASFDVWQGPRRVASFRSDSTGHFTVTLAPGTYIVVPMADAPIMNPLAQTRQVVVGADGLTAVQLSFDTGIR